MEQWTPRVSGRRQLSELLLKQPDRVLNANLLPEDLEVVITEGRNAEEADAEQKEQLTDGTVDRKGRAEEAKKLFQREDDLRDVVVVVVDGIEKDHPKQAEWLSRLSFARFRIRELRDKTGNVTPTTAEADSTATTESTSDAEGEEDIRQVGRVEQEDQITRSRNLGRYCRAILRPNRAVIVEQLALRNFGREVLERLATDAEKFTEGGRNLKQAVEATQREAKAAAAQKKKWNVIRRLVRKAVRGDSELEKKFAEC